MTIRKLKNWKKLNAKHTHMIDVKMKFVFKTVTSRWPFSQFANDKSPNTSGESNPYPELIPRAMSRTSKG